MLLKLNKNGPWSIATGIQGGGVVSLRPGVNKLEKREWELIKGHPDVKERLEKKVLEIIEGPKEESGDSGETGEVETLGQLGAPEAKKLVAETHNTDLLNEWLEDESRKGVKAAIEKQLADIEKEREESAGSDDAGQE